MGKIGWRFAPLNGDSVQGISQADKEIFKGEGLVDNMVREALQNALDSKMPGCREPVRVVFKMDHIDVDRFSAIADYQKNIKNCRKYWGSRADEKLEEFLENAEGIYSRRTIPCLVISDYNTTGASRQSRRGFSAWDALTNANGVSVKSDSTSGGSYGIGKNAALACSDLGMAFYGTYVEGEGYSFMGTARLATTLQNGKPTHAEGKYRVNDDENDEWLPLTDADRDPFMEYFKRTEQGTDIIIPAFSSESDYIMKIRKAAIRHFFIAIKEGKLAVEMYGPAGNIVLDKSNIDAAAENYALTDKAMEQTLQFMHAFENPDKKYKETVLEKNDLEIFLSLSPEGRNSAAYFRNNGMHIYTARKNAGVNYSMVVIAKGRKLSALLRSTEPANHNQWDPANVQNAEKRKQAADAVKKIRSCIDLILKEQSSAAVETEIDADGVGEFLPDAGDPSGMDGEADLMRPKVRIAVRRKKPKQTGRVDMTGRKTAGGTWKRRPSGTKGSGHDMTKGGHGSHDMGSDGVGVMPAGGDYAIDRGGDRNVKVIDPENIRAFMIDSKNGIYKIVWFPDEDYENLFFRIQAVGEDGTGDSLEMLSFSRTGLPRAEKINVINKEKAGPVSVEAGKRCEFAVRFDGAEQMKLKVNITEEETA